MRVALLTQGFSFCTQWIYSRVAEPIESSCGGAMRARPAFWIVASIALLLGSACIPSPIPRLPRPPQPPPKPNLPPPAPSPSYSGDMHAVYRNIKVLHGPASALDSIMREFNTALGVQCSYCHLQDKW